MILFPAWELRYPRLHFLCHLMCLFALYLMVYRRYHVPPGGGQKSRDLQLGHVDLESLAWSSSPTVRNSWGGYGGYRRGGHHHKEKASQPIGEATRQ
jgi:hypothetical protein